MDLLSLFQALILGIVEGLTEFLPVSSTGHLIVVGQLLNFNDERGKLFEIVIQSGAIFALCWEYRVRIRNTFAGVTRDPVAQRLVVNLAIAFVPAALIGVLFLKLIKTYLFNAPAVAAALIVGAFIIFWAERRRHVVRVHSVDQMTPLDAFKVGLAQVVSLIPGTSRSGSTIIGGLVFGLSRQTATEFSFLLSIPMLLAATGYEMYKGRALLAWDDMGMWMVGFVAAFISAFFCVRWLLRYVAHHDFVPFAWYRVFFGAVILITWQAGLVHWVD